MATKFREESDQLSIQLTGMPLDQAVKANRIRIVHDPDRALTQVVLLTNTGTRTALVGGRGTLYRALFVRIGLGRLACARPNGRFVIDMHALDKEFARRAFDMLRCLKRLETPNDALLTRAG